MSVRSMTGYGRAEVAEAGLRVEVEISSVNRKQLDIALALPKALGQLESRVHEDVARVLSRGRITVDVTVRGSPALRRRAIRVDERMAAAYASALRSAGRRLGLADDLSLSQLLSWPGVLHYETVEEDVERIWPLLHRAMEQALRDLARMRAREGRALGRDLARRLATMSSLVGQIRRLAPAAVDRYRVALRTRLAALAREVQIPDERLERELILFADKSDITEELTRLLSHLEQAVALLRSAEPAGKALDFLAQEMYREINTTGAKANDAGIARRVVLFKTELDRFREQVQNIE